MLPDILVHPKAIKVPDVRGPTALVVVEISESSLEYDLLTKAPLYASHGVREYWVINAQTLVTTIHRQPSGSQYAAVARLGAEDRLVPRQPRNSPSRCGTWICDTRPCNGHERVPSS